MQIQTRYDKKMCSIQFAIKSNKSYIIDLLQRLTGNILCLTYNNIRELN